MYIIIIIIIVIIIIIIICVVVKQLHLTFTRHNYLPPCDRRRLLTRSISRFFAKIIVTKVQKLQLWKKNLNESKFI